VICADHSHAAVERRVALREGFDEWAVAGPGGPALDEAEIALCPNQRAAMVYALVPEGRAAVVPRIVETAEAIPGVELLAWQDGDRAVVRAPGRGELRFAPGRQVRDARGGAWDVEGDLEALVAGISDGRFESREYPDALRRVWAALSCETSGDVLISAGPGYEFPDFGGADHVGGGSHGSLHRSDSLGALAYCGIEPPPGAGPGAWSITDVAPMVRAHFGVR
jgi:hypothetical protein